MTKTALDYPRSECRRLWRRLYGYSKTTTDPDFRARLRRDQRWLREGCTVRAERPVKQEPGEQLGPVNGSASLAWIEEPTRAGWWWWCSATERPRPYLVIEGAWITSDSEHHWLEISLNTERLTLGAFERRFGGGRWAGPIEEPPARDEETTPNAELSDSRPL